MKKFLLVGGLALSFVSPAFADLKVALVDTGKAFDAFYMTKTFADRIAVKKAGYEKEIQSLRAEYADAQEEAQSLETAAKDPSLSLEVRKGKDTALAEKVQDMQSLEQEIERMRQLDSQEIKDALIRSHEEIADKMMKIITDYVSAEGYDLVLDKSAVSSSAPSFVPYSSERMIDLTAEVIERLNASAPSH